MSAFWFGRYFSLWEEPKFGGISRFRIGGPEAGGLIQGASDVWVPGEDGLYVSIFDGLASRLDCELFVSAMDTESWIKMAHLLDPIEVIVVPVEWDDHEFHVITEEELESGEPTSHNTVCFSLPRRDLRETLSWIWRAHSQIWFPLLGIMPHRRYALVRWRSVELHDRDARELLLEGCEGLLYVGCPRELYLIGSQRIVDITIEVLGEIEQSLARWGWLDRVRGRLVVTEEGSYYLEGDPHSKMCSLLGRLADLATP